MFKLKMSTSGLIFVVSALLLGYITTVSCQVSFSTHWGGGKRSSIFKSQPDGRSLPSMFATEKESSIFDSPYELSKMFRDKNNLWQCLDRMEVNVLKYISLILEKEKRSAKKCITTKDVDYD
ncbi:uncharacterized protein LOC132727217 isoform X3 [Ruditapes philippinarum]|uniref:uncharacterized protein LOC132727217 isoform X3 n=1 Tax=Ruditapes philippinarum TaxID=129788 RepID=UPI00295B27A4|nr:uncharacterized protein LOC132727217 isoform X3 [Ruditapes philippinarum]